MKSLKSRITLTYIFLAIIIGIVGLASTLNIYILRKSVNGLMTNNYKSINDANNMNQCIQAEENNMLMYILGEKDTAINNFYNNNDSFYKWFNCEHDNITEIREKEMVYKTNNDYVIFQKSFSELQEYTKTHTVSESIDYYNNSVFPKVNDVKTDLNNILKLNETAMFKSKDKVSRSTMNSMYIVLIISFFAIAFGLIISLLYTKKWINPIYLFEFAMKSVKEGDFNTQVPVINDDEIGMLAGQFNLMTKKLFEYERSTKGKLLTEKNKSLAIIKSISDPLIVLDSNYKITHLNKSFENIFHISELSAKNRHFLEIIRISKLYDYIFYSVTNNITDNKIIPLTINKINYFFDVTVTSVLDEDSKINNIVVLLKNVTEFKKLEKTRTDFIATISHELKTPLTSIMMGVGLMLQTELGETNEKQRNILFTLKEDTQKLTDLVNNLLQLTKIQSEKAVFNIVPRSIIGIIENSISTYYDQAKNQDVSLHYEANDNLPKVLADDEKITWVLNNLISNALKYTGAGDEILISAEVKKNKMLIYVKDTGEGIPDEYKSKIFDRFMQGKDVNSQSISIGLGLFVAKEIVQTHEGEIFCTSELDSGSTFSFTLPLAKV